MNVQEFMQEYHDTYVHHENRLYKLSIELIPFMDIPKKEIYDILKQFIEDKRAEYALDEMRVTKNKQLEKFALCRMAKQIDIEIKEVHCVESGRCRGRGFVCKTEYN